MVICKVVAVLLCCSCSTPSITKIMVRPLGSLQSCCASRSTSIDKNFIVAQEDLVTIAEHSKDYIEIDNQMATKL